MAERHYLDVPFEQKAAAKAAGARWDRAARSWYAPRPGIAALAAWTPLPELLPGEDRSWGQGLFPDLTPSTTWFTNVRSAVSPGDWERLRKMVHRRAGHRCEACGATRDPDARRWLEAHERWRYLRETRSGRRIQRLTRLVALCAPCHQATHFGHAQIQGRDQEALAQLCHVNGWTAQQAWEHVDAAFELWQRRSQHVWELDLSMLTDAGVTVTPPPAAVERPAHAAAGLEDLAARRGRAPASPGWGGAEPCQVEPGVTVRAVTMDEVAGGDDPLSRLLRGDPPR